MDTLSKSGGIRMKRGKSMIVIIACLFILANVFGQEEILPYLYLGHKNGIMLEIPFADGTISIMENQILIDTPNDHYEYDYNDIERFFFKDKSHLTLSHLTFSEGMLIPEFSGNIFSYTLNIHSNTTSLILTATANDPKASVTGDGLKYLANGTNTFIITVTAEDGETALDYTVKVNLITGTIFNDNFDVAIYPNPTTGKFTVHIPDWTDGWFISIFNMQGKKMETGILSDEYTVIDINQFPAGVYLLEIITKTGQRTTKKLVKE